MKTQLFLLKNISLSSLLIILTFSIACSEDTINAATKTKNAMPKVQQNTTTKKSGKEVKKEAGPNITVDITGMVCGGCEKSIKEKVETLKGIKSCTADHKKKNAVIVFEGKDPSQNKILAAQVISAINELGYKAKAHVKKAEKK